MLFCALLVFKFNFFFRKSLAVVLYDKAEVVNGIFIWVSAIAGTVKSFMGLKSHSYVETICYVVMGLSVLVAFGPLLHSVGPSAVIWIIAEGVCYITGALFYCLRKRRFMHTVFHFFVLAGSVCHIIAVWDILMKWL